MQRMQTEIMQTGGTQAHEAPRGKGKMIGIAVGGAAVVAAISFWIAGQGSKKAAAPEAAKPDSVAATPVASAPAPAAAPVAPARITVTGLPRGGSVSVDGRTQPGQSFDLADGQHQVVMQAPGYESASMSVTATAGKPQRLAFTGRPLPQPARTAQRPPQQTPPAQPARPSVVVATPAGPGGKGVLQVRVNPWANISVDGVDFPAKTGIVDTLLPGAHSVRFERDGFITLDTVITVKAGDQSRLNIRLTPKGEE
jgi:hypothetical protein